MINIKDTLTLSDNHEYVVVSKAKYNETDYYYLLDIKDNTNAKFCYIDGKNVKLITDQELITKLLPLFFDNVKEEKFD